MVPQTLPSGSRLLLPGLDFLSPSDPPTRLSRRETFARYSVKALNLTSREGIAVVQFESRLEQVEGLPIVRLPRDKSAELPSRGMVMAEGTINGVTFRAPLEPDGRGGHWFKVEKALLRAFQQNGVATATIEIAPVKKWPEPKVPPDLKRALAADGPACDLWKDITPNARWDWIRWISATRNPSTRAVRIAKTLSKLKSGKRTACCFDRSQCTEPDVSRNGVLLPSTE